MTNNITNKNIYGSSIKDNTGNSVELTRVYPSNVQEKTISTNSWVDDEDGIWAKIDMPSYKLTRQVTVEATRSDLNKFFTITRVSNSDVRVFCWYVNGAGKVKPTRDVKVYASNQIIPDGEGTL
ncbi:hypothetical protein [Morganella morganii]|uniref:hypothetical protein n=1 Tax=Morganella morganii TaxID=582 RepID=UPI001BD3C0BA|nr:hypothetical protein [Morganella morganii]